MQLVLCLALAAAVHASRGISTKMDFGEPPPTYFSEEPEFVISNSTAIPANKVANNPVKAEDVDVEHTIVVSTRLKNNNNNIKRGFTSNGDTDGTLTYNIGQTRNQKKQDNVGDVPVVKSYKAIETTAIRTPDTRYKTKIYPDSIFVNRNIRDEGDVFPNVVVYPLNWKPANFYNNINYRQDDGRDPYMTSRRRPNQGNIQRKISEEGQREFYCKKCAELSRNQGFRGCGIQQRSSNSDAPSWKPIVPNMPNYNSYNAANGWHETTTQKMKIDGKLAKLN
ncbi:hypothetical protein NE865_07788 [Phthorimaea operculella]|nr:hypothetical protein NE865_07788 [Phthorimaea operculella]